MKIYGNWGLFVYLLLGSFVVGFLSLVIFASMQKVDLVDEKYYDKEGEFVSLYNKIERTKKLSEGMKLAYKDNNLLFQFPKGSKYNIIGGDVYFFRPSEKGLDFHTKLVVDSNYQAIYNTSKLAKGLWRLKIDWAIGDSTYYNEESVILN